MLLKTSCKKLTNTSTGYIRFHRNAVKIAKELFEKKEQKHGKIFYVVEKSQKPAGSKNVCKRLTGEKQNPVPDVMIYTKDVQRVDKIFTSSLVKEGRLSVIMHRTNGCVLFITKNQEKLFDSIKSTDTKWPMVFVNELDDDSVDQFYKQMNTMGVELHNILEMEDDTNV